MNLSIQETIVNILMRYLQYLKGHCLNEMSTSYIIRERERSGSKMSLIHRRVVSCYLQ